MTDSIQEGLEQGLGDTVQFVATLVRSVRLTDVLPKIEAAEEEGVYTVLSIQRFEQMRSLAVLDLFCPELTLAERLDRVRPKLPPAESMTEMKRNLKVLRTEELYPRVLERMAAAYEQLSKNETMMAAAENLEPLLVQETLSEALFGSGRDRQAAIREFTGRMSAKKGREATFTGMQLPPKMLELIERSQKLQEKRKEELESADVVDAEYEEVGGDRMNVPLFEAEGE